MNGMLNTFKNAFRGLKFAFETQKNIRIHLFLSILSLIGGFLFRIAQFEWLSILICMGLVFGLECMNTAIEELTDHVSPEYHFKAGRVKDLAASSVLVAAIISFMVALFIFLPKICSGAYQLLHAQ